MGRSTTDPAPKLDILPQGAKLTAMPRRGKKRNACLWRSANMPKPCAAQDAGWSSNRSADTPTKSRAHADPAKQSAEMR